MLTFWYI